MVLSCIIKLPRIPKFEYNSGFTRKHFGNPILGSQNVFWIPWFKLENLVIDPALKLRQLGLIISTKDLVSPLISALATIVVALTRKRWRMRTEVVGSLAQQQWNFKRKGDLTR